MAEPEVPLLPLVVAPEAFSPRRSELGTCDTLLLMAVVLCCWLLLFKLLLLIVLDVDEELDVDDNELTFVDDGDVVELR